MDAIETLKEHMPTDVTAEETAGAALFGFGLVTAALRIVRGDRAPFGWMMPAALITAGLAMLIDGTFDRRSSRMAEAELVVREELAGLDPIARAQVLKGIAEKIKGFAGN